MSETLYFCCHCGTFKEDVIQVLQGRQEVNVCPDCINENAEHSQENYLQRLGHIMMEEDESEDSCNCLECVCPKCGDNWIETMWQLSTSKLYKGQIFISKKCRTCDREVTVLFRGGREI